MASPYAPKNRRITGGTGKMMAEAMAAEKTLVQKYKSELNALNSKQTLTSNNKRKAAQLLRMLKESAPNNHKKYSLKFGTRLFNNNLNSFPLPQGTKFSGNTSFQGAGAAVRGMVRARAAARAAGITQPPPATPLNMRNVAKKVNNARRTALALKAEERAQNEQARRKTTTRGPFGGAIPENPENENIAVAASNITKRAIARAQELNNERTRVAVANKKLEAMLTNAKARAQRPGFARGPNAKPVNVPANLTKENLMASIRAMYKASENGENINVAKARIALARTRRNAAGSRVTPL